MELTSRHSDDHVLQRLIADGFVRRHAKRCVPTDRWHAAVAHAAAVLLLRGEEMDDLKAPIEWALTQAYADSTADEELIEMIMIMTPLTAVSPLVDEDDFDPFLMRGL